MSKVCQISGKKVQFGNNVSKQLIRQGEDLMPILSLRNFIFLKKINGLSLRFQHLF